MQPIVDGRKGFICAQKCLLGDSECFLGAKENFFSSVKLFYGASMPFLCVYVYILVARFVWSIFRYLGAREHFLCSLKCLLGARKYFLGAVEYFRGARENFSLELGMVFWVAASVLWVPPQSTLAFRFLAFEIRVCYGALVLNSQQFFC